MENIRIAINIPKNIINRIDEFKIKNGFTTRTQTIVFLLHFALDAKIELDSKKKGSDNN